jgi:hypothetical protein
MISGSPLVLLSARNGLIAGILGAIMLAGLYYVSEIHPLLINPFIDFRIVLFALFIFFTLKEYRSRVSDGILYFWQGMIGSYTFLLVYGVIMFFFILLFSATEKEFTVTFTEQSVSLLRQNEEFVGRIGKEEFERNFANAPPTNGLRLSITYLLVSLGIGFPISAIISVVLRKQSPNP